MKFKFKKETFLLVIFVLCLFAFGTVISEGHGRNNIISRVKTLIPTSQSVQNPIVTAPSPTIILKKPSSDKVLENNYYISQHFNNCGPASLSMALSYYGINKSQEELGEQLRPYQIASGDNDDKSVTLQELAEKSKEFGFTPYHLPNGDIEKIKLFITYNIPVIARTWLHKDEDIGHYRVIKGYDDTSQQIIQDDSYEGKNLRFSYSDFRQIWKKFNYEYLALIPNDKLKIAEEILGEDKNAKTAWGKAIQLSEKELAQNSSDVYARFNLSVAYYNTGDYQKSAEEFEKVENLISFRTLWYQIEPIKAYYQLGNYDRVFEITDRILNNHNRAFSELYIMRGNIYKKQGNIESARNEYNNAAYYNKNLEYARE